MRVIDSPQRFSAYASFMTDGDDLLKLVRDHAVVRGRVTLSSGQEADWYVDLRRLTLHYVGAPLVGQGLLDLADNGEFDAVGGLTRGADPVVHAMLAVEDTSITGGSVPTAVEALREAGAGVGVAVIVDRGAEKAVRAAGLSYRSAFSLAGLGQQG
jgi:orotate phosphoribosyltransferase